MLEPLIQSSGKFNLLNTNSLELVLIQYFGKEDILMNKNVLFAVISVIATFFATVVATSACLWFVYQPEEPKCLSDM